MAGSFKVTGRVAETTGVTPAPTTGERCPECSAALVEITFTRDTSVVAMRSCSRCHCRFWFRDGAPVSLAAALGKRSVRPFASRRRHR